MIAGTSGIVAPSGGTVRRATTIPDDPDDDAPDVGRSSVSPSPLPTTSTATATTTSPAVDDDDARSRRKAEKRREKAERRAQPRAQPEGCGDPAAGRKPRSLRGRPADLLVRCTHDEIVGE